MAFVFRSAFPRHTHGPPPAHEKMREYTATDTHAPSFASFACAPSVPTVPTIPTIPSPSEHRDSCVTASLKGAATGFLGGSLLGAVFSNWSDRPLAVHNQKALPALQKTGALMAQHGSTLGAVGLMYATTECALRAVRGKDDVWNGVAGGVVGGMVLGARSGNPRVGVVGCLALAAVSATVDASGYRLTGGRVDDALSPQRSVFPYNQ